MEGNPPLFYRATGGRQQVRRAEPLADKHVLAHAFKIVLDPYIGKMAVFRIHPGTIRRDSQLYIGDEPQPFRVTHLMMLVVVE